MFPVARALNFYAANYRIYIFYLDFLKIQNQIDNFEGKLDKIFVKILKYFPEICFLVWNQLPVHMSIEIYQHELHILKYCQTALKLILIPVP